MYVFMLSCCLTTLRIVVEPYVDRLVLVLMGPELFYLSKSSMTLIKNHGAFMKKLVFWLCFDIIDPCRIGIVVTHIHGKDERAVQFCQAAPFDSKAFKIRLFLCF